MRHTDVGVPYVTPSSRNSEICRSSVSAILCSSLIALLPFVLSDKFLIVISHTLLIVSSIHRSVILNVCEYPLSIIVWTIFPQIGAARSYNLWGVHGAYLPQQEDLQASVTPLVAPTNLFGFTYRFAFSTELSTPKVNFKGVR